MSIKTKVVIAIMITIVTCIICTAVISEDQDPHPYTGKIYAELVLVFHIDSEAHEVFAVNYKGDVVSFEEDDEWNVGDFAIVIYDYDLSRNPHKGEVIQVFYERPDLVTQCGFNIGVKFEDLSLILNSLLNPIC